MIKTIIRKFLGIDFTPRKQLYAELNECYAEISRLHVSVDNERALRFNAEGNVLELEEQIKQLQCRIEELENYDEPDCDEGADPNPDDEPDCDEGEPDCDEECEPDCDEGEPNCDEGEPNCDEECEPDCDEGY